MSTASPLAPFRRRAFAWLWLGVVIASVGMWGQLIGAQWLFINDPNAATIVPLIQTFMTLPMMLLALPAGVLADAFDRRWLLFGVQVYFVAVSVLLAALTAAGLMPPALLLAFVFALGAGQAVLAPTWQAMISDLVPREELAAATRLDMVSVNVSRAAGPALAGVIISIAGVPWVFALNALAVCVLAAILLAWRRPLLVSAERERFIPALRTGGRYVRHEPVVRRILTRLALFILPACAVWALLPLIANRQLGLAADGYGLLFAALGVGAVGGALGLGYLKRWFAPNAMLTLTGVSFTLGFALLAVVPSAWLAIPLLILCGFGWTATVATVISELQLFLPGWVRARAIAIYVMVFLGGQTIGSPIWGFLTQYAGLRTAMFVAAGLVGASVLTGVFLRVPDNAEVDRTPAAFWGEADVAVRPEPDAGPVVISIQFEVAEGSEADFLAAMQDLRRSRLRSGATRWDLFRVGEQPCLFNELFEVPSWREHERQHDGRLTAEDQSIEERAFSYVVGSPRALHLLPTSTPRTEMGGSDRAGPDPVSSRWT